MNKKTKGILFAAAIIVVLIALFLPNNNVKEKYKLETIACSEVSDNQTSDTKLTKISCDSYNQKIQEEADNLILIARPTCGACVQFIPILEEIVEEYDITINYFDTDALSDTEINEFYSSSELYKSRNFGTPTLLVSNNKEIVEYSIGYKEKQDAVKWLKKVGFIK